MTSSLTDALDLLRTALAEQAHAPRCSAWADGGLTAHAHRCDCWLRDAQQLLDQVEAPTGLKPWKT